MANSPACTALLPALCGDICHRERSAGHSSGEDAIQDRGPLWFPHVLAANVLLALKLIDCAAAFRCGLPSNTSCGGVVDHRLGGVVQ